MNLEKLIGKQLKEACLIIEEQGCSYVIKETVGYKDREILIDSYVLRAIRENDAITLTTGLFKTTI